MKKVLAIAALSLCLAPASRAAEACKDQPVPLGQPKFEEQVKKAAYDLVLLAESKTVPATADKDADAEFLSRGVIYSRGDGRAFVPKSANDQVVVKVKKKKGSQDMAAGKPFALYLKKEKDSWVLAPCSHTHELRSNAMAGVEAEQWYINKAYGVANAKKTPPPIPDPAVASTEPLDDKPAEAPKEAPKNLPTPPGMGETATGPDSAPKPPPAPGTTPIDLNANLAPISPGPAPGAKGAAVPAVPTTPPAKAAPAKKNGKK